jgi:hypothetical protein
MTARVYHVTVGYPRTSNTQILAATAEFEGFISVILPEAWPYQRMSTRDRIWLLRGFISSRGLGGHDIILATDAYDVFILQSAAELVRRFWETGAALVFSAARVLSPADGRETVRAAFDAATPGDFRYLNSGCIVGYAGAILAMLDWCLARAVSMNPSDHGMLHELAQDYWLAQRIVAPRLALLDTECNIFASLSAAEQEFALFQGRIVNPAGHDSCILHANGSKRNLNIVNVLFGLLYPDRARKAYLDLRILKAGDLQCAYSLELRRISASDAPGDLGVYLLGLGSRFSLAFTPRTGALTFHPEGAVTSGADIMAEWEVLFGVDKPLTMHGYHLMADQGTELQAAPVPLDVLKLPCAADLIRWAHRLDSAPVFPMIRPDTPALTAGGPENV